MLQDDKRYAIKLYAENFLQGNLDFRTSSLLAEKVALLENANYLKDELIKWVSNDETVSEDDKENYRKHKIHTHDLYFTILGFRTTGHIKGKIIDKDLNAELVKEKEKNSKLKDEKIRCMLQNDELKKDNVLLARELKDKTDLVDEYERTAGVRKP